MYRNLKINSTNWLSIFYKIILNDYLKNIFSQICYLLDNQENYFQIIFTVS